VVCPQRKQTNVDFFEILLGGANRFAKSVLQLGTVAFNSPQVETWGKVMKRVRHQTDHSYGVSLGKSKILPILVFATATLLTGVFVAIVGSSL
jgi:hypothetical protein